ncbi:hypothetical protein LCGC14_1511920 [marine sediment metagenome]|uniref:Phage Gp37Gp68 family protein n=1 Tax=marine sediment metagenome TaxID=412755 RepID=A0A0F9J1E9_9ZZZZ
MSTNIAWTDEVWNPTTGCAKVSSGCKNCYAEGVANRFWARQYPEVDGRPRRFTDVQCHPDRLERPLHWTKPRRVFVNSMSDLFHEDVPDEFIDRVFDVIALAEKHTFQVLTKRPERMRDYVKRRIEERPFYMVPWPLPNVWLGVSVEDQETADARIPELLATPAAVRWVSLEPQLGPVDLTYVDHINALYPDWVGGKGGGTGAPHPLLDWVVQGGESGAKARPFDVQWARDMRDQCEHEMVPYFLKQLGAKPYSEWERAIGSTPFAEVRRNELTLKSRAGADESEWPEDLRQCRAWPKVPS